MFQRGKTACRTRVRAVGDRAVKHRTTHRADQGTVGCCGRAVAEVHESAVGMYVDRTGGLSRPHRARIGKRVFREEHAWVYAVRGQPIHLQLVLTLERQEEPRATGMKVQVP